jgi:large subunit ribosomal protein LX
MKAFRISGRFRMGHAWQDYSKEVAAVDEAAARERLLSVLGSQHGVARKYIEIRDVAEVPVAELRDHAVRYTVEGKA